MAKELYFRSLFCFIVEMSEWIEEEYSSINLGDKRLNKRAKKLLKQLSMDAQQSIASSCCNWAEAQAAYRFFNNEKLTEEKLLAPHREATLERMKSTPRVLCIEDTTFFNHTSQQSTEGLGPHSSIQEQGYFAHCMLALTPQNQCLGVLRQHCWARSEGLGKRKCRVAKPIEEKESFRWLEGYREVESMAEESPQTHFVYVADREADIYEIFNERKYGDFLLRAQYNRNSVDGLKLKESVRETEPIGKYKIKVPAHMKRKNKNIPLSVKVKSLSIKAPYRSKKQLENNGDLVDCNLTVILVQEESSQQIDDPIQWLLLTSISIENFQQAIEVIGWYCSRWNIEVFFRILKSGCRVESLQLKSLEKLKRALAVYMLIAWRILLIKSIRLLRAEESPESIFTPAECKAILLLAKQPIGNTTVSLAEIINQLACLGGYLNRKNDSPPGPKAIWAGLVKIRPVVQLIENKQISCV